MNIANIDFQIDPYVGVGPVKFGMGKKDVEKILGKPEDTYKDFLDRTVEVRGSVSIKYAKSKVNEMSFLDDADVFLSGINVLKDKDAIKKLDAIGTPHNSVGFKIYFDLGIMVTGFSKKKEDKTLSVFTKELEPLLRQ